MDFDAIIVGAGPFGLSGAAYLKNKGVGVGIFGDPMSFWRDHMPAGMYLRSNWAASHISDPHKKFTLDHFKADTGLEFQQPVPLERFVEYGQWYQQKAVPELVKCQVKGVEKNGNGFKATLEDGQVVKSKRVVIATGIAHFPWMPKEFEGKPKSHVSHSSDHCDLSRFAGKKMAVIGGGAERFGCGSDTLRERGGSGSDRQTAGDSLGGRACVAAPAGTSFVVLVFEFRCGSGGD